MATTNEGYRRLIHMMFKGKRNLTILITYAQKLVNKIASRTSGVNKSQNRGSSRKRGASKVKISGKLAFFKILKR